MTAARPTAPRTSRTTPGSTVSTCNSCATPNNDADAYGAIVEDNLIYRNHNRGIQLYPDTDNALIQYNVLDQNGANLNLGSEWGQSIASQNNLVENNVLTDSAMSGLQPGGFVGDTSEVLGQLPAARPGNSRLRQRGDEQLHLEHGASRRAVRGLRVHAPAEHREPSRPPTRTG